MKKTFLFLTLLLSAMGAWAQDLRLKTASLRCAVQRLHQGLRPAEPLRCAHRTRQLGWCKHGIELRHRSQLCPPLLSRHRQQRRDLSRCQLALWLPSLPQLLVCSRRRSSTPETGVLWQQPRRLFIHPGQCGTWTVVPPTRPLRELRRLALPVGTERRHHSRQHPIRHLRLRLQSCD